MQIVVNHLTRMRAPRICIAGVDPGTQRHVRPTSPANDPIERRLLDEEGGPLGVGVLIDLGDVRPNPSQPETEDHMFSTAAMKRIEQLSPDDYFQLLEDVAEDELGSIFGPELKRRGRSFATLEGTGTASLGVLRVSESPTLEIDSYGKLRLVLTDLDEPAQLGVTDVQFVEADHKTLRGDVVEDVRRRLARGVDPLLMVGLARPFIAAGDNRRRHWAQVNGICMIDRPIGARP